MSKKRGFTLVEILVVVAITTLVLAMVGGLLIFMAETSGTLIHKSEELMLVQSIESYLRGALLKKVDGKDVQPLSVSINKINKIDSDGVVTYELTATYPANGDQSTENKITLIWDANEDAIKDNSGKVIFKDTGLSVFRIYLDNEKFVRCELKFEPDGRTQGNHTYDFIIGINNDINYGG